MHGRFAITFTAFSLFALGVADAFIGFSGNRKFFSSLIALVLVFIAFFTFYFLPPKEIFSERARKLVSLGLLIYFAGKAIEGYFAFVGNPLPCPSFADAFWIIAVFPIAYGIVRLGSVFSVELTAARKAVIALVSAAFLLLLVLIAFVPIASSSAELAEKAVLILAVLFDWFLFTASAYLLAMLWRWHRLAEPIVLLTAGLAALAMYDAIFGRLAVDSEPPPATPWLYVLCVFGTFLFAMAAVRHKQVTEEMARDVAS
ncbi:MAG: hypothetical protein V1881_00490 [Candidatus Micrarchaeota archaeon]